MAVFDMREELMGFNMKLATLNAALTETNAKNLQVNYQILHMSLKSFIKSVKEGFPEFSEEMIAGCRDIINVIAKNCLEHCSEEYRSEIKNRLDSNNQTTVDNDTIL